MGGYYLYGTSCYTTCPGGYTGSDVSGLCCKTPCADCSGPLDTQCISCETGYFLDGNTCVSPCPSGYFEGASGVCCISPYANCFASTTSSCSSCMTGYVLYGSVCETSCPTGIADFCTGFCCTSPCSACFGQTPTNCIACVSGYHLLGDNCVIQCPLGFFVQGSNCNPGASLFLDLSLDVIKSKVADSANKVVFTTGASGLFYPGVSPYNPLPTLQRGYYFGASAYMSSSAFEMTYNFTMVFYIKINSLGTIMSKDILTILAESSLLYLEIFSNVLVFMDYAADRTLWIVLDMSLWKGIDQIQHSVIQIGPSQTSSYSSNLYSSSMTSLYLGSLTSSFTGFIWRFQIYSSITDVSAITLRQCASSADTSCVNVCSYTNYIAQYPSCQSCTMSCANPVCRRGTDCSLCINVLCASCDNYNTCLTCMSTAVLNAATSVCQCAVGTYWDINTLSCSACASNCPSCTGPSLSECLCSESSYMSAGECVCDQGFTMVEKICQACEETCFTCSGPAYYQCLSCEDFFPEGVCLEKCPIGYVVENSICVPTDSSGLALRYFFDLPVVRFSDQTQGVDAIGGGQHYRYMDSSDPIPAYQRGIYFTGIGSYITLPYSNEDLMQLGVRFFVSLWINPISSYSPVLYKSYNDQILFALSIINFYVYAQIEIDSSLFNYTSINPLLSQEWNHVLLAVEYDSFTIMQIFVNNYPTQAAFLTVAPYTDVLNLLLFVGTDTKLLQFFNGFLYLLEFYISMPALSQVLSTENCNDCSVCLVSEICIPNCGINTFYNSTTNVCEECNDNCSYGCRNQANCSLCLDAHCVSCSNYSLNSCTGCDINYEVKNSTCVVCDPNTFYNSSSKTCQGCSDVNSFLNSNRTCECNTGYSWNTTTCIRNEFYALISLNSQNVASIIFTEDLNEDLETNNIQALYNGAPQNFTLQKNDNSSYLVYVSFATAISDGDKLQITFEQTIISILGSLLSTKSLTISLFAADSNAVASVKNAITYAQVSLTIGLGAVFACSCISFDPITFFNFLNNIQLFYYVMLYQVSIDAVLIAFLNILNPNSWLPNVFSYAVNQNDGVPLDAAFNNFGNNVNLILINSGQTLTMLAILLMVPLTAYFFRNIRIPAIRVRVRKLLVDYKYRAFLRFFLQAFLELSCNSIAGIYYSNLQNNTQIVDFTFCICIAVLYM